ncbi:tRNA lysidine(34) synthetase TilS [Paenibacillus spongiae]|uniref:tRNA(Ile)-lysidine synthase n=1 Tax=Paenibacillus spongiae TaxID=2909671 RepID=A0ABY5S8Y4_9BACL|nr:tRNA lysidine(34) synthetase TilS [Paenibacillus spongiae]UVI30376.1 tRNA lysidine(34) synthetase TilS [Paenibacillus spongiae]
MGDLMKEVADIAAREKLWVSGDTIVVAVSGGPDSTALLDIMHRLSMAQGFSLVAAHVDHGFRGEESAREAVSVRRFAEGLGVRFESALIDVPAFIEETRMNAQAAAREKRYLFLHDIATKYGASRIALAHHADDQAETVLMRIIRGTSPGGLSGIPLRRSEKNVELIRPLLRMNKSDILRYCEERVLTYSEDSSNAKRHYFRNSIRLDVLPALTKYNPQLSDSLVRLSELASAEDEWMDAETRVVYDRHVKLVQGGCQIDRKAMLDLHVALQRRLIKLILNYMGLETETTSFDGVETIRMAAAEGAPSTWSVDVGGGIRCLREYDTMRFVRADRYTEDNAAEPGRYAYDAYGGEEQMKVLAVPEAGAALTFTLEEAPVDGGKPSGRLEAVFDADELALPLAVRNRRPGDRMRVLGLNGAKKVQDMFVDDRIAPSRRERLPLLVDADGHILWIPGVRRGASAQISDSTQRVLRIRADFTPEDDFGSNKTHSSIHSIGKNVGGPGIAE